MPLFREKREFDDFSAYLDSISGAREGKVAHQLHVIRHSEVWLFKSSDFLKRKVC